MTKICRTRNYTSSIKITRLSKLYKLSACGFLYLNRIIYTRTG